MVWIGLHGMYLMTMYGLVWEQQALHGIVWFFHEKDRYDMVLHGVVCER